MEPQNESKNTIALLYEMIKPFVYSMNNFPVDNMENGIYEKTATAAFVKCFEYVYNQVNEDGVAGSFFLTSALRGICEDLISLKYLARYDRGIRDAIVSGYMKLLAFESIASQRSFFDKESIIQPVIKLKSGSTMIEDYTNDLKEIWAKQGFNKDKIFPGVQHMAVDTGMQSLYNFLYHATSRAVHFSPNVLLRMGWYNTNDGDAARMTFTTSNFEIYYKSFNVYHGTYLFLKYVKEFKKELAFDKEFLKVTKQLKHDFKKWHCPEIITFEEMNQKRPFSIVSLLADKDNRFKDSL